MQLAVDGFEGGSGLGLGDGAGEAFDEMGIGFVEFAEGVGEVVDDVQGAGEA